MQFIDEAIIIARSGNGGNGVISFRREKYIPKGGPDGGNGGKGGDVVIIADKQLGTLLDFKYKRSYKAQNGEPGRGKNQEGKSGKDILIRVPCGTLIKNADADEIIVDLTEDGASIVVAKGGKGGKGNSEFATPTNRAPRIAEPGESGVELRLKLELKLLADAGLVGFPNAGKSTLISAISAARPKIADYPFTTLVPNLGMVYLDVGKSFTVADIPGLIEGASEGKGLGIQFLRHVERTRMLCYLIETIRPDPKKDFAVLQKELKQYAPALAKKRKLVLLTKADLLDENARKRIGSLSFGKGIKKVMISAVTREGIDDAVSAMWKLLHTK